MVSYIIELNGDNYDNFVSDRLVLIDVWAEWCGPCRMISPIIDVISSEYYGRLKVGKLDADYNRDKVIELGVRNIPTIFLYKNGEIVETLFGLQTKEQIAEVINKYL